MGKRGSWFSAIKRVFIHSSKEKPVDGSVKKSAKEKKGRGVSRHGETKPFIPLFREPSSIEKILGEAEQQKILIRPSTPSEQPNPPPLLPPRPSSPRVASLRVGSPRAASQRVASPRAASQRVDSPSAASPRVDHQSKEISYAYRPEPTLRNHHLSATKIQAAYRGYMVRFRLSIPLDDFLKNHFMARRSFRALRGLVRLQGVLRGQNVKRQTINAVKQLQLLVRVQTQIQSRRIQMLENQALHHQAYKNNKEVESTLSKWTLGQIARRSFRALRGLVRLQGVLRGQNVKRQTINAVKQLQLLVRVQTQIQSRRIQMLENQALHHQAYKNNKEVESTLSKWTLGQISEAGYNEEWDDSLLTKEEIEARLQRKVEAVLKRERAMAYAYSHQLWKANPTSVQIPVMDLRYGGLPWWWNWLERQLAPANPSESQTATKNIQLTPPRPTSNHKQSPRPPTSNCKQHSFGFDNHDTLTPRSSRSTLLLRTREVHTSSRTPQSSSSNPMKYAKTRAIAADSAFNLPLKDDDIDSLTSCPPFSVPNYMAQTVSAKAKARETGSPKERFPGTPNNASKMRFSFPLTPKMGSFRWKKGSTKDSTSLRMFEKHESLRSIGDFSVDSAISMPAAVGRKPFNRFV
ncbi:unnamed protein product [Ilex paraguariensis]|uniref:DUF4005 domain-containing protein n=1 Tax=Ilex paraguariensis TaxID=185542 RepID=A0ABC8SXB8_9AQUA